MMVSNPLRPRPPTLEGGAGWSEAERRRGVQGVADVQVVREGLGPVLGGVHARIRGDVILLPARRRTVPVVPVQRRLIVGVGIAEQRTKPRQAELRGADKTVEVVVPDLVAQVPQHGAVRLVHRDPQLLAVHIVALSQIQCDHAVVVAGDDRLQLAGQQVERQAVLRVRSLVKLVPLLEAMIVQSIAW
jgi:hypothetical protein